MAEPQKDLTELLQRAFRYALSLVRDRATAEDIVQEACLAITKRGGPWEPGYVLTAVRNKYIDRCRRAGIMKIDPLGEIDVADANTPVPMSDELSGDMERALGRLSPGERELIYLAIVEQWSMQEIATMTGKPRGTVLSGVHRAKEKLRQWLSSCGQNQVSK